MIITSLTNPYIKELNELKKNNAKKEKNMFLVDGLDFILLAKQNNLLKEILTLSYLEEYQDIHGDRGLEFKVYFENRLTNERGIVDVLDKQNQMIYDFKFGYPNKTPEMLNNTLQMQKYRNHFKWPSEIIKPQIKY